MVRPKYPREFDRRFWSQVRAGLRVEDAAAAAGVSVTWARRTFRKAGGVNPTRVVGPAGRYLCWAEREEIAALDHAGHGVREIARRLGRDPGTISRELSRGATHRGIGPRLVKSKPTSPGRPLGRRSWPRIFACANRSKNGSNGARAPSRLLADSRSTSPTNRRCGCRPRRSINRCMCRLGAVSNVS